MNDATPPSPPVMPPASAPVVAPAASVAPAAAPARGGVAAAALVVAVVALVMAGVLWQRLGDAQEQLARRAQDTAEAVTEARTLAAQAEATSQELQARLSVAEVRLSEVSLQRTQLEELMLSLSRSRDDNLVQDLESALRLAQQQAQLTGSAQPLVSALKAADQRIARAAQPRLNPVQRAIARDIERLQSAALADIPALALQLDELARQVDNFPLLNQVGPRAGARPVAPPAAPLPPDDSAVAVAPAGDGWWARAGAWWSQRWATLVNEVTASGRELVRVSRIDRPEASLVAPEQAFFLRENLKLKLLNARLALLARHMSAAQADVVAVQTALNRYFDTSAAPVRGALTSLGRLQRELVDTPLPRPDDTLQALTAAAGGR